MRLRDLREDREYSQQMLAQILNVRQNTYSQYETQARQIPLELLCRLADFYHTSVDYILERTDDPRPYPPKRK